MENDNKLTLETIGLTSPHVQAARFIYHQAFAHSKPVPFWCLQINALRKNVQFLGLCSENRLLGLAYLLTGQDIVFIYYFAIIRECRSQGYGATFINLLKQQFPQHKWVLNLPLPDGCETQREQFYLRLGFRHANFVYTERGLISDILVCGGDLTAAEYVAFLRPFAFYCYPIRTLPK